MKTCSKCNIDKPLDQFYVRKDRDSGYKSECKTCNKEATTAFAKKYYRREEHLVKKLYMAQKNSAKKRNELPPDYSLNQLDTWIRTRPQLRALYDTWVASGYSKMLRPSCDGLNDYKPYTLDNLRLVTWAENKDKGSNDRRNGINNKVSKAIEQLDLQGNVIASFHSANEAARQTGGRSGCICNVLKGRAKTHHNFKWRYK